MHAFILQQLFSCAAADVTVCPKSSEQSTFILFFSSEKKTQKITKTPKNQNFPTLIIITGMRIR